MPGRPLGRLNTRPLDHSCTYLLTWDRVSSKEDGTIPTKKKRKDEKVPVTIRGVTQRINRSLRKVDQVLKSARSEQVAEVVGSWYVVGENRAIVQKHVDVEALARKLGVLADYERLEEAKP